MRRFSLYIWRLTGWASIVLLGSPAAVEACTKCFGMGVDTDVTRGISMAMLGLLLTLGVVWGGIGMFAYNMKKRADRRSPGDWRVNERGEIELCDDGSATDDSGG